MRCAIFQKTAPPREQAALAVNAHAAWYTWSPEFRSLFGAWRKQVRKLKGPRPLRLLGGEEYDNTFSLSPAALTDTGLTRDLMPFVEDLYHLNVGRRIMLFDRMLGEHLCGHELHCLFAYFRAAIVAITGDPLAAIHQPLHREYKRPKEFPLHADLYVPRVLLNIFDDVPADTSGASTFLSVPLFLRMLPEVKALEGQAGARIAEILTGIHREDKYEEFYHLLHGSDRAWRTELAEKMAARQLKIKLRSGQGYLIDDRAWLHGRDAPSSGVTRKRLHRLIFNTKTTLQRQREQCVCG